MSADQGLGDGAPDHTDASGTSPPARRRVTQRQAAFLSAAFAVFGAIASVAQLVSSTWQTLLVTLLIVLAVGLVVFGVWWTTSRGRQIASLSFRLLAALILGALLLGAGGTAGARWMLDSRPVKSQSGSGTGTSWSPTVGPQNQTPAAPTSAAPSTSPTSTSEPPPSSPSTTPSASVGPPPPLKICSGLFQAEVRIEPTQEAFDVVASYGCRAPDTDRPWVFVRLTGVGEHETTNYYALEEFTGHPSPYRFHSKPVDRNPSKCYLVVVFTGANPTKKEFVNRLPSNARQASSCVQ
ncbi:hypothetical protein [Phytohabitans houttuyneae]|uniref:Uncharacterized protein n=1 Tax=Phytohabitans houttuyneae TaxID=1076126 RepID=A0A6V8KVI1_9ACTN|nr:hypothetical protein [Phytohabitans houttuyneae]GFJ85836.1 hypothetical protein Phou_100160 [Phytohabitans houttuyneae]